MTIQEAARYSREQLMTIYDESEAVAITDWMMEHLTGKKRAERPMAKNEMLPAQVDLLAHYLERLRQHEPLQYVLQEAWFCGFKFYVDQNVLIPRPETEELVEWIITDCRFPIEQLSILDIGSGSGCIPVSLKRRLGKASVAGCDVSAGAVAVANRNASSLGVKVDFMNLDFLSAEARNALPCYDIIVSNPPYIPEDNRNDIRRNVLDHEPPLALFVPSGDALLFYRAIADFGQAHLNKNGKIYVEINEFLGQETAALFHTAGYTTETRKDMQGKERMIRASLS